MCSYMQLVRSALKSREDRRKFMQTCVPHLLCLLNVTTALLFDLMYARYGSVTVPQSVKNFMAIQFLMLPPLLNPIIYGLKLTQVRSSFLSLCTYNKQGKGLGWYMMKLCFCVSHSFLTGESKSSAWCFWHVAWSVFQSQGVYTTTWTLSLFLLPEFGWWLKTHNA